MNAHTLASRWALLGAQTHRARHTHDPLPGPYTPHLIPGRRFEPTLKTPLSLSSNICKTPTASLVPRRGSSSSSSPESVTPTSPRRSGP
jgi:hypothetical protein